MQDNELSKKRNDKTIKYDGQNVEVVQQRNTKEEKIQSKTIFDQLMKNIEKEQKDRQDRITHLQECIREQEHTKNVKTLEELLIHP